MQLKERKTMPLRIIALLMTVLIALPAAASPTPDIIIRSITIIAQKEFIKGKQYREQGVRVISPDYLRKTALTDALQQQFIGQKLTVEVAHKITDETLNFVHTQKHPIVDVYIPQQDITGGNLVIVVDTGHLGAVKVKGNHWLSDNIVTHQIQLTRGDEIDSVALEREMVWLNKSPFHKIDPIFTPGANPGDTDLVLETQDRIPFRPYIGFDNGGNKATGDNRFRVGFTLGDLPTYNSLLSYEYVQASDYSRFWSHSLNYSLAMPNRDTLFAGASYSKSEATLTDFGSAGDNFQTQLGYKMDLRPDHPVEGLVHDISAGVEYKYIGNNLQFGGTQVYESKPEVNQLFVDYNALLPDTYGSTLFNIKTAASPGGISHHNTNTDFDAARQGASDSYMYAEAHLERILALPQNFSFKARGAAQISSTNLLGSEQMTITDHDNVRGYAEDTLVSDEGYRMNLELFTPETHPAKMFGSGMLNDALQGLIFFDYGYGTAKHVEVDSDKGAYVASAGIGARYQINTNFYAQGYYGVPLRKLRGEDDPHAYFSLAMAY